MKLPTFTSFASTTITYDVSFIRKGSRLRALTEDEKNGELECSVDGKSAKTKIALLNCKDKSGKNAAIKKIDLSYSNIAGTPETAKVETNPSFDYSSNLDINVPQVIITSIEKGTCSTTGQYIIKGTSNTALKEGSKITIPFSSPDSGGLCHATSEINIIMTCENTEKFDVPMEMIILPQMIYQEDDTNPYFQIINSYTKPIPFSCVISDKSLKNDVGNLSPSGSSASSGKNMFFSKSSSGLSGGVIAGIVIACVAAGAIIGVIIVLSSKGFFSKGAANTQAEGDNSSSLKKFSLNNHNVNIV